MSNLMEKTEAHVTKKLMKILDELDHEGFVSSQELDDLKDCVCILKDLKKMQLLK